jgi:quinohemoprotein ethanol dehydrogenase
MKIGKRSSVVLAVFGLVTAIAGHGHEAPPANGRDVAGKAAWVTGERIVANEPQNWLSHGRGYDEKRHSPLKQISVGNVSKLKLAWFQDLDTNRGQEATPIVVDGLMFTTSAWSHVQAFDAVSGRPLWTFDPKVPGATGIKACCDVVNRGVAVWEGKVYVGALDGRLIALDAKTGKELWSTLTVDPTKPYTITGAPRVVKGKVLIGNGGAESGVPLRLRCRQRYAGVALLYDAQCRGQARWRRFRQSHGRLCRRDLVRRRVEAFRRRWHDMGFDGLRPAT